MLFWFEILNMFFVIHVALQVVNVVYGRMLLCPLELRITVDRVVNGLLVVAAEDINQANKCAPFHAAVYMLYTGLGTECNMRK